MKKYYGYFIYNDEEYVIRFKIDGNLQWSEKDHCFIDDQWYVRTYKDLIAYAAIDNHWINDKRFGTALGLTHDQFVRFRAKGIRRWNPKREIIKWH